MALALAVVTPEAAVLDIEVDSVVAPGAEGEFGALPGHERLLAPLREGVLEFATGASRQRMRISGGFAEVTADRILILADSAEAEE